MFVFLFHGIAFLLLAVTLFGLGFFTACYYVLKFHREGRLLELFPKPKPPDEAASPTIDITPNDGDGPKFTAVVDLAKGPDKSVIHSWASCFPLPSEWDKRDSGQLTDI